MQPNQTISDLLMAFRDGRITREEAERAIRGLQIEIVGEMARLDIGRTARCGMPEAILGEGKTPEDLAGIMLSHVRAAGRSIATRASRDQADVVLDTAQQQGIAAEYREGSGILILSTKPVPAWTGGIIGIITAGTSDRRVAEEAQVVAEEMGCRVKSAYDVGVAGIHRLFPALRDLLDAHVFIVVAGREGTLPAIVAGLADRPVIGVPVSTGYGYMGGGRAALASMLQSCSALTVVNIDAGFIAGACAARIANMVVGHG
ncbi:MAG: nickel pincer cofactor biosynthesis protein LarB [Methanomicrobiales archaeon]|nr:nickel pincer cofactor biosynthesis protein LarB [Methanomicrobiales archaeon]